MSNPAQEEADRLFTYKPSATSHPEDRQDSHSDADDEKPLRRTIRSSRREDHDDLDPDDDDDDDDDDENTAVNMATVTTTKNTYTLPATAHFANTGPKGVIADAQNYQRAKRSTFRRTIHSISDSLSLRSSPKSRRAEEKQTNGNSSGSEIDLEDGDDDFMQKWRQQRLTELQEQYAAGGQGRAYSPGRKIYGTLDSVNANGYLDAVENTPKETHVVVLLFDPDSKDSLEVEDELKTMAYRWSHVRFIKLHHEIAEMETVDIPAILAYRGGDVFATISGAERDGLEGVLRQQGVLSR